ncbi:MAG TPA: MFS transporter, partial [Candidatus Binataceae bacterium]|nr:MFS transporter [Candidatus Binataceae bacterium]
MDQAPTSSLPDSARAWLMAMAAFFASFVVFGVIYSFGVFLKPMAAEFHANAAKASAFFSFTSLVYYVLGAFTGRLADRFGPRMIVAAGAVILGLGLCLTALTNNIWVAYLTYGLGVG